VTLATNAGDSYPSLTRDTSAVMAIYNDEMLNQIVVAAADQRSRSPKRLPDNEIEIGSPTNSTAAKPLYARHGGTPCERYCRRTERREKDYMPLPGCGCATVTSEVP
jgi:hypothetical protein